MMHGCSGSYWLLIRQVSEQQGRENEQDRENERSDSEAKYQRERRETRSLGTWNAEDMIVIWTRAVACSRAEPAGARIPRCEESRTRNAWGPLSENRAWRAQCLGRGCVLDGALVGATAELTQQVGDDGLG